MDDSELNIQARHDDRLALNAQIRTAAGAIEHVLNRIHKSPEVGYYMGYGTESFERLCVAYSEIHGELSEATKERFHPLQPRDPTKALVKEIEALQERLSGKSGHICHDDEEPEYGPENLTAHGIMERVREILGLHSKDPERCVREIAALYDLQQLPINLCVAAP